MRRKIIKVVTAAAVCAGLFAAAFLGVNQLAFAAPTVNNAAFPQPAATNSAEEAQAPGLTLYVRAESQTPGADALSPEDAAKIGAEYILDMFDVCIDSKMVHLMYSSHPSMTRSFWFGIVTLKDTCLLDELGYLSLRNDYILFEFRIDAVSGKRIDIMQPRVLQSMSDEVTAALDAAWSNAREDGRPSEEMIALRGGGPAPANLDAFKEAVKEIAANQFNTSEVVNVEFRTANATGFDLDENGNLIVTGRQLIFAATDCNGRIADIAIDEATKQLRWIFTAQNDICPDFRHVGDGPGRG